MTAIPGLVLKGELSCDSFVASHLLDADQGELSCDSFVASHLLDADQGELSLHSAHDGQDGPSTEVSF